MISEYKKEKARIEKFADQWCVDNNYLIRRSNYKKSQNMIRPYKGTWWGRKNKKEN
tara:strand:+ start:597 stop:764 length:168 start_codon:yes stop_codon:yes gene_type:complete